MGILDEMLEGKKSIVILGHVNPDGDCIGSCLAMYNYLTENYGELRGIRIPGAHGRKIRIFKGLRPGEEWI